MRPPLQSPLTPLFDQPKRFGSIAPGNTPPGSVPSPFENLVYTGHTSILPRFPVSQPLKEAP